MSNVLTDSKPSEVAAMTLQSYLRPKFLDDSVEDRIRQLATYKKTVAH
jgi:hypothetical protein